MFVSKEQVLAMTGYEVNQTTLAQAQTMIEVLVGKSESEVTDATDLSILGRATALQAAYIGNSSNLLLEQASIKSIVANETTTVFDLDSLAPHYSKYAVLACRKLSWMGSRSVRTGPVFDSPAWTHTWETI